MLPVKVLKNAKKKGKKVKFILFAHSGSEITWFSWRKNYVLSKVQPFQRIIQQNCNCELIRKAKIKPRIILIPQRVCKKRLKAHGRIPIGTSFHLLQNRRLLASNSPTHNELNEQSRVNQVSPSTSSCGRGSTTYTNNRDKGRNTRETPTPPLLTMKPMTRADKVDVLCESFSPNKCCGSTLRKKKLQNLGV